jgi:hypothetical protein
MKDHDALVFTDPRTSQTWRIPLRPLQRIVADVEERWMLNVALSPAAGAALVEAPFLAPQLVAGHAVLALCIIRMARAAPDWAPLHLAPPVLACALRVACTHRQTGEPAVWVATRFTDHILGRALPLLGFPDIRLGLERTAGPEPALQAPGLAVEVTAGPARPTCLFPHTPAFDRFIADGVRSYGRGPRSGTWSVVDLIKDHASNFTRHDDRQATLTIDDTCHPVDGIYHCLGGRWHWDVLGTVDAAGLNPAGSLPPPPAQHAA